MLAGLFHYILSNLVATEAMINIPTEGFPQILLQI